MTLSEKAKKDRESIIAKVRLDNPNLTDDEAYQAWKQKRYHNPENAEKRSKSASIAGKAVKHRTFHDPEVARAMAHRMWEKKRGKNTEV